MPALTLALTVMVLAIFSLFILYDVNRIVKGGETNYVSATLALYMNVYNVFQALLALVGIGSSKD
jgi:modulator of FtsH protease